MKNNTAPGTIAPLKFPEKFGFLTFSTASNVVYQFKSIYYLFFLTNILKIDVLVAGAILTIGTIWDAVNDPMMGALMDKMYAKHHNKNGKFRPWLLRAAPLLAITSIVFWTVPTLFDGYTMLVVLFFCKILYEGCYTMFNIPMGSLLSAMANTDGERAALSSARGFGSMIGNVIPMMILPQLLAKFGDTSKAFGIGAAICASIGFVFCFLHYYWTEERNVADTPKEEAANVKFTDILSVFKKNRAFLALCIHGVCICCMQYVGSTLGTYMYSDVLGNIGIMSLASVVSMPLSIVALLIMPKLAEKFGLEKVIRTCLLIGCGLYMGLFAVMMLFSVPAIVYLVWSTMASGIASVSILMQWGLVGEAIDYNELLTGKRTEGSIYGTFNLSRRIGQTVGNSAAVLALGWIGYDANLAAQSAGTLTGIKALCVLVPGIFLVGSWIAFRFVWNITPEIRAKMAASKAAKSAQ